MPSKNFSHFSRSSVLTNGRFWYLRAQKVIFPQPWDLIFLLSVSKKKNVSAKFSQKKKKDPSRLPADIKVCWMVRLLTALSLVQAHRYREREESGQVMNKQCPRVRGSIGILGGHLVHSSVSRKDSPFPIKLDHHRTNSFSFRKYWEADFSVDQHMKTSPLLCIYLWS